LRFDASLLRKAVRMSEALPIATFLAPPKLPEDLVHRISVPIVCDLKRGLIPKIDERDPGGSQR